MANPVILRTDKSDKENRDITKEKIISNTSIPKLDGQNTRSEQKKASIKENNLNFKYRPVQNAFMDKNSIPIQPAGSNYDLIVPETGVTIIEGAKKKQGDKDYFRKYQKYSKYDYHLMLKESVPQASLNKLGNSMQVDDLPHNQLSLPHINTSQNLNSFTGVYGGYGGNMLSLSTNNLMHTNKSNKLNHSLNLMESMKLSNRMTMSLKSTLDALDLIPEYEEDKDEEVNNLGGSIIANRKVSRLSMDQDDNESLETMNKFNFSIIKNNQWGAGLPGQGKSQGPGKKHYKPDLRELEKELGSSVISKKMPRSRVFNNKNK